MDITHKISTYLPWSGHLCGEDYAHRTYFWLAITSAKRCYRTCAHPPIVCLLRLLFTVSKVSICLLVFQAPSFFIWVLVFRGFPFLSFSLSLNKRAVVVRSLWSTVDSSRQLMHWSFLHLLFSWPDNAVLCSLLSIHISSNNTELQCKAARARMECNCIGKEQGLILFRCCLAAAGGILSSFTGILVYNMKSM